VSTDYGFCCLDCKDCYIVDDERNPDTVASLIMLADKLAELVVLDAALPQAVDLQVSAGYGRTNLCLAWFATHKGHKLEVIDEYGGFHPRCGKTYKVEGEKFTRYCKKKENHDGEACSDRSMFAWANHD